MTEILASKGFNIVQNFTEGVSGKESASNMQRAMLLVGQNAFGYPKEAWKSLGPLQNIAPIFSLDGTMSSFYSSRCLWVLEQRSNAVLLCG